MSMRGKKSSKGREEGRGKGIKRLDKNVEFSFSAPEASKVYLAGEFNQWDTQSLPMKKDKNGVWKTKIKLFPGFYEYKFFSDSGWVEDIPGVESVTNPFGTQNFVISVQ